MNRFLAKALRIAKTVVEVVGTACGLFVSIVQTREAPLWRVFLGLGVASLGSLGTLITTWSFEGRAIAENARENYITSVDPKYRRLKCLPPPESPEPRELDRLLPAANGEAESETDTDTDTEIAPTRCCTRKTRSRLIQGSYITVDTSIEFFKSYLLLLLIDSEVMMLPGGLFWTLFIVSNVISLLFRASNATYCGTTEIAQRIQHNTNKKSMYAKGYKGIIEKLVPPGNGPNNVISTSIPLKVFGAIGSAEHTVRHLSEFGLILLMAKDPIMLLVSRFHATSYILMPLGILGGVWLVPVTFATTWFFDFNETKKIANQLLHGRDAPDEEDLDIPPWLAKILYFSMPVMPFVEGAGTAVAIVSMNQIIDPVTPAILATAGGLISVLGNVYSETRAGQNALAVPVYREKIARMDAEEKAEAGLESGPQHGIN